MLSIMSHMDARDIAQEVVMERMVHKGSFVLLEGKTDIKRFRPFLASNECSMVSCNSVLKAIDVLKILIQRGINGVISIIDADFSRVRGHDRTTPNTIVSENHDLDLDWINTRSLSRYLDEVADDAKVASLGGKNAIVAAIHATLRPVSAARLLNKKGVFRFRTSGIDVAEFYSHGNDICADYVLALIAAGYVDASQKDWIELEIRSEMNRPKEDWQMTNGHDFCAALGAMLLSDIGNRKVPQCWSSEIETHIRLAFDKDDFLSLRLFQSVSSWEDANIGFRVLSPTLSTQVGHGCVR
jgi:hypothetical protein